MKYLVIGSGGREHALAWKLATESTNEDSQKNQVWVAPGNAGIATDTTLAGVIPVSETDFDALADIVTKHNIDIVVVGPEAPLAAGIADDFQARNIRVFGPSKDAAQLETSKAFTKEILDAAGVKTAQYQVFTNGEDSKTYLDTVEHPIVVKADGLAAGKGVFVCQTRDESEEAIKAIFAENRFGDSGSRVVIEEFLDGTELSFMIITDGNQIVPLATSRDHKRLLDGDQGPNTGGMGAITPAPTQTDELFTTVTEKVFRPVLAELKKRGISYKGFLYAGLMLTSKGVYVLEFNVRMGDPETQAIMLGMTGSLGTYIDLVTRDGLSSLSNDFVASLDLYQGRPACCVVMASGGYPGSGGRGHKIEGLPTNTDHSKVFFAGVGEKDGELINTGGRVLGVTAVGETITSAIKDAYDVVSSISWTAEQHRTDIGK